MFATLRVKDLDKASAQRFERAVKDVPGIRSVDTWNGSAKLRIEDDSALRAAITAATAAGFTVSEPERMSIDVPVAGMSCNSCETLLESTIEKAFIGLTAHADAARGIIRLEGTSIPEAAALQKTIGEGKYRVELPEERPSLIGVTSAFAVAIIVGLVLGRIDAVTRILDVGNANSFGGSFMLGLFAGSSACMAVAGGIMLALLGKRPADGANGRLAPVGSFIVGRVASYAGFGALIGAIGAVLRPPTWLTGALIFIASAIMIVSGLTMLGIAPRFLRRMVPRLPHAFRKRADAAARSASAPLIAGAATFFVPCGFTQALQVYALSSGSAVLGAIILGGFALGTAPALFAVGWAARSLDGKKARMFTNVAGAAIVLLGFNGLPNAAEVAGVRLDPVSWVRGGNVADLGADAVALPPIVDGVQVIRMTAGGSGTGYSPDRFVVRAGVPVEWHVDQQEVAGCLSSLVSRPLDVEVALVKGENVVTFTAPEPGTYGFSCGMGMFRGDIVAVRG